MPNQDLREIVDPSITIVGLSFQQIETGVAGSGIVLDTDGVAVRAPSLEDGALMWEITRQAGTLDLNSPYAYVLQCRNFRDTCAVAEVHGRPAGFVTAHRLPDRPYVLFVWQIAVLAKFRRLGIAQRLLNEVLGREINAGVRTLEATVTPSNTASAAFFRSFAEARGAQLTITQGLSADAFPAGDAHEREDLFVITPFAPWPDWMNRCERSAR